MFAHGFDEGWLKCTSWRSQFLIKDGSRLREMHRSGLQYYLIDVSNGRDVSSQKVQESAAAKSATLVPAGARA